MYFLMFDIRDIYIKTPEKNSSENLVETYRYNYEICSEIYNT